MSSYGPPWKLALIGLVAVMAGAALLLVDWTVAALTAFVAMLFVARGALHAVTTSFEGVNGALSALLAGGEFGVGALLLAWPSATVLVLVVVVGALVLLRGIVDAVIVLATRSDRVRWRYRFASSIIEIALGVTLIARLGGTVRATALTLGLLAILDGTVEIATAVARKHGERRVQRSVPYRSVAVAS